MIDLDGVINDAGEMEPWAAEIVAFRETYCEISPSGKGLRMFARGALDHAVAVSDVNVELYSDGRYCTVTGKRLPDSPDFIAEAPKTIAALLARVEALKGRREPEYPPHSDAAPRDERSLSERAKATVSQPVGSVSGDHADGDERRFIEMALSYVPADNYSDWVKIGGALCDTGQPWARQLWDAWSQKSSKFDPDYQDEKWTQLSASKSAKPAGVGTIIHIARQNGFTGSKHDWALPAEKAYPGLIDAIDYDGAAEQAEEATKEPEPNPESIKVAPANADGKASPPLDCVNAASLADLAIPEQRWHVVDLIPCANVTILSGDGATGKSLLALQLAASTATGGSWIGLQPAFGKTLFVSAEDEIEEVHRRLARIEPELTLLENLEIVPLAGKDAILAAPTARGGLLEATPLFGKLKALVEKHKPILLVLDTLADLFGGNEIEKVHARAFISMLRGLALKHGCAIVLLSHPSQSGMASGSGTSGNVAWNNSVRSRLYFERVVTWVDNRKVEVDHDLRLLSTKKANRARHGTAFYVRWKDGVFERDESLKVLDAGVAIRAEAVFLALLEDFEKSGREVSCKSGANYAPAVFAKADGGLSAVNKKDLERAMHALFKRGRIKNETFGPPSRQRSKIVAVPVPEADEGGEE
jgi:RecA-family ATPase